MKKVIVFAILFLFAINSPALAALVPLGSYQVSLSQAVSQNNAQNAARAASLLNGTIISPGQTFSYNQTVGDYTAERGFIDGAMFDRGEVVSGIGGGVCMTSSILHQAVKAAGLKVIERHNHSMPTSYLRQGEDAAVAYGIEDYKFKNNTGDQLQIEGKVIDNNLIISVNRVLPERNCRIHMVINDKPIDANTRLIYDHNVSFVPLREIVEAMGEKIYWDGNSRTAELQIGKTVISLPMDKPEATINNATINLKTPLLIANGQTMIPVRSSCEALGLTVYWDQNTGIITAVNPKSENQIQDISEAPVLTIEMN